jgi:hypothetical protein
MIKIVILQRGWVFIGKLSQEGTLCTLTDAYNIRRWGTTDGLGQLALEGKQAETKLDKIGTVSFHELTSVAFLDVNEDVWKNEFTT